jgi:hypothetical protein
MHKVCVCVFFIKKIATKVGWKRVGHI